MEDNYIDDGLMQALENDMGDELHPHDDQGEWESNHPDNGDWQDDPNDFHDEPDIEPWDGE
jgi:hypothetical protein